ncbi:zinc-binding dehydrogenase [Pseudofrankia sp. BMG5.37]|uniref:zinc-binding dehydrogenase n=1 Tax=Pseudofrankia sp. BMG5.37 TaxID=3050035 RepID=UPI002893E1E0|nr:zinc-binding dehydrogenase [Pseudofrankia sp. BMG5.37]MDT3440984.1 zinc-binding dehydrogenase [Pseudofrankia sp. BMG5.37]
MEALVYDPDRPAGLRLAEVAEPVLRPDEALVEVRAISLNFGELAYRTGRAQPGQVHGWDAAGVVVAGAEDGSGAVPGTPVVTFGWDGAWARRRAASTADLAVLPTALDPGAAAALPVAGVTALRAIRRLGSVLGRRVLITGASGGVGRFAVQLAARAGAEVIASVGTPERGEGLGRLGATDIVIGPANVTGPVHGALDNVGGTQLAEAFALLEPGGVALAIGKASGQPTTIDFEQERHRSGDRRIEPFVIGSGLAADLGYLVRLLGQGRLDPQIGWRGSWERAPEAVEALLSRRVAGKAILDIPA